MPAGRGLFWMWMAAFVNVATKYAKGMLLQLCATGPSIRTAKSPCPVDVLHRKRSWENYKPLAVLFAFFGVLVAFFGIGTFTESIHRRNYRAARCPRQITRQSFSLSSWLLSPSATCSPLPGQLQNRQPWLLSMSSLPSPLLAIFYEQIPAAIYEIIHDAFTPTAAAGFLGATVLVAMPTVCRPRRLFQ